MFVELFGLDEQQLESITREGGESFERGGVPIGAMFHGVWKVCT
jgi:hypothetical protein